MKITIEGTASELPQMEQVAKSILAGKHGDEFDGSMDKSQSPTSDEAEIVLSAAPKQYLARMRDKA